MVIFYTQASLYIYIYIYIHLLFLKKSAAYFILYSVSWDFSPRRVSCDSSYKGHIYTCLTVFNRSEHIVIFNYIITPAQRCQQGACLGLRTKSKLWPRPQGPAWSSSGFLSELPQTILPPLWPQSLCSWACRGSSASLRPLCLGCPPSTPHLPEVSAHMSLVQRSLFPIEWPLLVSL